MNSLTESCEPSAPGVERRASELLREHEQSIYRRTDRVFTGLLIAEWIGGSLWAYLASPRSWEGATSTIHPHVYQAVLLGALIVAPAVALAWLKPGTTWSRHGIAAAQAAFSALLIHVSGGRIETHFHVFGSLAFVAFYRDWKVLLTASAIIAADHCLRGLYWPRSIFGVLLASPWRWLEHAAWVVFEDCFLIYSCIQGRREMGEIAFHRATLEAHKDSIEAQIATRTAELVEANESLETSMRESQEAHAARDEMEIQLQNAQKLEAVGQLAAGIAHEINTPIQYVGDNTRFLQDCFADTNALLEVFRKLLPSVKAGEATEEMLTAAESALAEADPEFLAEEVPQAIEQCLDGIGRVSSIVLAMKDFSHPGVEDFTTIDLNRAIESTATVCRNEWKYCAEIEFELDSELPEVECLPGEINQVVLNIIVNAAHAIADTRETEEGPLGKIRIATQWVDEMVQVTIQDSGAGMSEAVRAKIFDPFFTTKGVGKGTGQGLAIAHSVVTTRHQGSIQVESEPGKGTTFTIKLPVSQSRIVEEEAA